MTGIITGGIVLIAAVAIVFRHIRKAARLRTGQPMPEPGLQPVPPRAAAVSPAQKTETGPMVYYANDGHNSSDKEYRFNYKMINGAWRAYILKMPDLGSRNAGSVVTHRLWDENNNPYICWNTAVTSLGGMQNISRKWADCIQEYIATGKRFGPE